MSTANHTISKSEIPAQTDTPSTRPAFLSSSRHPSASGIEKPSPPVDNARASRSVPGFTPKWIKQYLAGKPSSERENWLSDSSAEGEGEEDRWLSPDSWRVSLEDDRSAWLQVDDDDGSIRSQPSTKRTISGVRRQEPSVGSLLGTGKGTAPSSTNMFSSKYADPPAVQPHAAPVSSPVSTIDKPLEDPPAPHTPQKPRAAVEEKAISPTRDSPSAHRPSISRAMTGLSSRKKVIWKGKTCVISLPATDARGLASGSGHLLEPAEVQERIKNWRDQGFDTRGFSHWGSEESLDHVEGQGQSRRIFPDPEEIRSEMSMRDFKISIPDRREWEAYVNHLNEEKLRALGVSFGDEDIAPPLSRGASSTMSRQQSSHLPVSYTPPLPTSSAASNQTLSRPNPFSPVFIPGGSTNPSSNVASPGSSHPDLASISNMKHLPLLPGEQRFGSPVHLQHQQQTPPIQGLWNQQQLLGQYGSSRGGSPALPNPMQNFGITLQQSGTLPTAGTFDQLPQAPMLNGRFPHQDQRRDSQHLSTFPNGNDGGIANPTPRGHNRNISEGLQKEIDEAEYHLEASIQRQLDPEEGVNTNPTSPFDTGGMFLDSPIDQFVQPEHMKTEKKNFRDGLGQKNGTAFVDSPNPFAGQRSGTVAHDALKGKQSPDVSSPDVSPFSTVQRSKAASQLGSSFGNAKPPALANLLSHATGSAVSASHNNDEAVQKPGSTSGLQQDTKRAPSAPYSGLNVAAKEFKFNPTSTFTPGNFSFTGSAFRSSASPPSIASTKQAPQQPVGVSTPSVGSNLNVKAPSFLPAAAKKSTFPTGDFSFSSVMPSFRASAPSFTPAAAKATRANPESVTSATSEPDAESDSKPKIFSIPSIVKPAKTSKAIPIIRPDMTARDRIADDIVEDESGRLTRTDAGRKRTRHVGADDDEVPVFAVPSHPLAESGQAQLPGEVAEPIEEATATGKENEPPADTVTSPSETELKPEVELESAVEPELTVESDSRVEPEPAAVSESEVEPEPKVEPEPIVEPEPAVEVEPKVEPEPKVDLGSEVEKPGVPDEEAHKHFPEPAPPPPPPLTATESTHPSYGPSATVNIAKLSTSHGEPAPLVSPDFPPSEGSGETRISDTTHHDDVRYVPKTLVSEETETTASRIVSTDLEASQVTEASSTQNINTNAAPAEIGQGPRSDSLKVAAAPNSNMQILDETIKPSKESAVRDIDTTSDDAVESQLDDSFDQAFPSSIEMPLTSDQLLRTSGIKSGAPSPSPRRAEQAALPDNQRPSAPFTYHHSNGQRKRYIYDSPALRQSTNSSLPFSPTDETHFGNEPGLLHEEAIERLLESRLLPLQQSLAAITEAISSMPSRRSGGRRQPAISDRVVISDADDEDEEDDDESGRPQSRSRSPKKENKLEKIKAIVIDALASQRHAIESPTVQHNPTELKQAIEELKKSVTAQKTPHNNLGEVRSVLRELLDQKRSASESHMTQRSIDVEVLQSSLRDSEEKLQTAELRVQEEVSLRQSAEERLVETQRILRAVQEEEERHREHSKENERKLRQSDEDRQQTLIQTQMRTALLEGAQENLQKTTAELTAKNAALQASLEGIQLAEERWRAEAQRAAGENKGLRGALDTMKIQLEESIRVREGLRGKFDSLQGDTAAAAREIAQKQEMWQQRDIENSKKHETLLARLEAEARTRERLEREIERLEAHEQESMRARVQHEQTLKFNADLEDMVRSLRSQNLEFQQAAARHEGEYKQAREAAHFEVQRTQSVMQAEVDAANRRADSTRSELERVQLEANNARSRFDVMLKEAASSKAEVVQELERASLRKLQDLETLHKRQLVDLEAQHDRAVRNVAEDKERASSHLYEQLTLSKSRTEHWQDRVKHLEEKLEIAKAAAHAAVQAAKAGKGNPTGASQRSGSMTVPRSDLPEKISPQALRESILVLQEQLQQREGRIEKLEDDLSKVDLDAPNKIKDRDVEIAWLRELLGVRISDLEDIIATLSETEYDGEAVKDAAIRLKANLQMEQQERERAMAGGTTFPSIASIQSSFASPKAAVLPLAAAWGSWRKGRLNSTANLSERSNTSDQTPSKSSPSAQSFLSGLLTPPSTTARQGSLGPASTERSAGPSRLSASRRTSAAISPRQKEKRPVRSPPRTPPLLRGGSYDEDAVSNVESRGFYDDDASIAEGGAEDAGGDEPFGPTIIS